MTRLKAQVFRRFRIFLFLRVLRAGTEIWKNIGSFSKD